MVGFMMQTTGNDAAINAVVGLDTLGNGDFARCLAPIPRPCPPPSPAEPGG
jgi:hypothetical protein